MARLKKRRDLDLVISVTQTHTSQWKLQCGLCWPGERLGRNNSGTWIIRTHATLVKAIATAGTYAPGGLYEMIDHVDHVVHPPAAHAEETLF